MGEIQSLSGTEAITKLKHIASREIAMLCTFAEGTMHTRPMGTAGIDPDGTVWFMARRENGECREIANDDRVHLVYAVPSRSEYMALSGRATILRDQKKIDEIWNAFDKTWFHGGKDDPSIALIRFQATDGHYWDTKHNKMITLMAIALGAVTGKTMDDGVQGALRP